MDRVGCIVLALFVPCTLPLLWPPPQIGTLRHVWHHCHRHFVQYATTVTVLAWHGSVRGLLLVLLGEWRRPSAGQAPPSMSPWFYHTLPYNTLPYHLIPHYTSLYYTIPYHTTPHHTTPYHTIPYHTIPCAGQGTLVGASPPMLCVSHYLLHFSVCSSPRVGKLLVTAACEIQIAIHRG